MKFLVWLHETHQRTAATCTQQDVDDPGMAEHRRHVQRPLSERAQEMGFRIGLALVVMLMIFATFNDIIHLATS